MMDEGKILIVNLSKGLIGEDNAGILGAFIVTKIQLAAMSRSDIADIEDRRPFYLYVDEFQNFATDSFATILSEARKYGLNLTVANQYISQMSETVRNAVFGNVGTMITFRVSADDSPILAKQYEPQFEPNDLLQMHNRNFIINMVINGEKQPAFSARTLNLPPPQTNLLTEIIQHTREQYGRRREEVEAMIESGIAAQRHVSQAPQPPTPSTSVTPPPASPPVTAPAPSTSERTDTTAPEQPSPSATAAITSTSGSTTIDEQAPKPKRKRSRSRKKKTTDDTHSILQDTPTSAPVQAAAPAKPVQSKKDDDLQDIPLKKGSVARNEAPQSTAKRLKKPAKDEDETILRIR